MSANTASALQTVTEETSVPFVPGGGDLSLSGHLRHLADGQPDGAVQDRVPRSAALDEGLVAGTRSRHA